MFVFCFVSKGHDFWWFYVVLLIFVNTHNGVCSIFQEMQDDTR